MPINATLTIFSDLRLNAGQLFVLAPEAALVMAAARVLLCLPAAPPAAGERFAIAGTRQRAP